MQSLALLSGNVSHQRFLPKPHRFNYTMQQLMIDVRKFDAVNTLSPFWSSDKPNLVRLERNDYLPSDRSLYQEVQKQIARHCQEEFRGDAYLIASPRVFGQCFNPVSFIACYQNSSLSFLIAEVHNTPWNEREVYVHKADTNTNNFQDAHFQKRFHVSPFMPMDMEYRWRYRLTKDGFDIHMRLLKDQNLVFVASMHLDSQELTSKRANLLPWRHGLSGMKVMCAIYWQALKMWSRRFPIYPHPNTNKQQS